MLRVSVRGGAYQYAKTHTSKAEVANGMSAQAEGATVQSTYPQLFCIICVSQQSLFAGYPHQMVVVCRVS